MGGAANSDALGSSDSPGGQVGYAEPQRTWGAKVHAVVAALDLKSGSEPSWPAGKIVKFRALSVTLHDLNAFKRLDSSDQDRRGDSRRLAHDIEHEVSAVVKKNVSVTGC